ncbi:MAG TPA: CapA family protein [Anaerolineae bacterium]|nr:CapA family protein [Anaerolineae bacterium]HQH39266.1 CapA family protein [Anaerolineae bacterium]
MDDTVVKHACWRLMALFVLSLLLAGCGLATVDPMPTSTPTRTPHPLTPTLTPTPVPPTPTPTPAFPVTAGCAAGVPATACARFREKVSAAATYFTWSDDTAHADTLLGGTDVPHATPLGTWTYAVAAPFFTVDDDITTADLRATWSGTPAGPFALHALLVTTDTRDALVTLWGAPAEDALQLVAASDLLTTAEQMDAWAIVPFDELAPRWKALRVDGLSLLDKNLEAAAYPLAVTLYWGSASRSETLALLPRAPETFANRYEEHMTVVLMTGVTAMARGTAQLMDRKGVTYPAQDVLPWFTGADIVHISNEVSFNPDCVTEGSGSMSFCSHDSYIGLLEAVHTSVIELTGNHLVDKGIAPLQHTLEMYRERGWQWFGGGENYTAARQPAKFEKGPNKIAFMGCNSVDNPYDWATDTLPGVFSCRQTDRKALDPADLAYLATTIAELRNQGYNVIFTVQEYETESYTPFSGQIDDFRTFAALGPVYVQGSQAHQPQTMEFYGDTFIHYGLGNLFFDQMWTEAQQGFVNRLVFYDNRLLSIELLPTWLEEYGRPRPMTVGDPVPAADRRQFLQMIFDLRPQ